MIDGALAASVTPFRDSGEEVDEQAIEPLVDFLAGGGVDGILCLGTTGEGILLSLSERKLVAERFLEAARGRLAVAVHCGAQTTADTVALAAHAAEAGADAVAVIGPPYFAYDPRALLAHFAAAAAACAPVSFFLYEFADRSGYPIPLAVIEELRDRAPNLAGLKVSDAPWKRFEPYLVDGLAVFVGPEALVHRALERGAAGAVSGLAAAFPELVVELVREPTAERAARAAAMRQAIGRFPFHAAQKRALARRGVLIAEDVRAPLRILSDAERAELDRLLDEFSADGVAAA